MLKIQLWYKKLYYSTLFIVIFSRNLGSVRNGVLNKDTSGKLIYNLIFSFFFRLKYFSFRSGFFQGSM